MVKQLPPKYRVKSFNLTIIALQWTGSHRNGQLYIDLCSNFCDVNVKIVEEALNVLIEQLTINNCLHIMIVCDIHVYN